MQKVFRMEYFDSVYISVVNGPAWSDLRPKSSWTDESSSRTGPDWQNFQAGPDRTASTWIRKSDRWELSWTGPWSRWGRYYFFKLTRFLLDYIWRLCQTFIVRPLLLDFYCLIYHRSIWPIAKYSIIIFIFIWLFTKKD